MFSSQPDHCIGLELWRACHCQN